MYIFWDIVDLQYFIIFRYITWWFKIFTDYAPLIVIIRYWLYTLCCTIYPCMLVSAKLLQPCQILCNPIDHSPPGSSVHGVLQARILEWVAMPSSRDLPNPGIESRSLISPALAGGFFTTRDTSQKSQISFALGELKINLNPKNPYKLIKLHHTLLF